MIMNLQDRVISTPVLGGTIFPGITRKSIIEIARSQGFQVCIIGDEYGENFALVLPLFFSFSEWLVV